MTAGKLVIVRQRSVFRDFMQKCHCYIVALLQREDDERAHDRLGKGEKRKGERERKKNTRGQNAIAKGPD